MLTKLFQSSRSEPRFQKGVHKTKLSEIYWKIFVSQSLFNKVEGPELATLLQKNFDTGVSREIWKTIEEEHLFYRTPYRSSHLKEILFKSFEKFTEKHQA